MKRYFKIIAISLMIFYGSDTVNATTFVECPEKIRPSASLAVTPDGWAAMLDGSGDSYFDGVSVYDGHPKEMVNLAPDNKGQKTNAYVWTIQPHANRRVWIGCRYRQTALILAKEMPKGTSKCVVTFNTVGKINDDSEIKSIRCN